MGGFYVSNGILNLGIRGPQLLTKMWVVVKGNLMLLPVYLVSSVRWESLQDPNDKAIGIYGKKAVEQLKEFVIAKVVYVVKISDIEAYKKEKYKL